MSLSFLRRVLPVAALPLVALMFSAPAAHAQADISFSGGNGAPLTFTLAAPITYTITSDTTSFFFVFAGVGNLFPDSLQTTGTITFRIDGGPDRTIVGIGSDGTTVDVNPDDVFIGNNPSSSVAGNTVVLTAGTLTTVDNFTDATPAGGTFTTFLIDETGARASTNGVSATAAPEPGTIALVLPALPIASMVLRRTRRA